MSVFATIYQRLSESSELPWRALLLGVFVVGGLMIGVGKETEDENGWHTLYWYGAVLILTAQMSHTTRAFFMGEGTAPWLSVVPWQRHPCCPGRVGCSGVSVYPLSCSTPLSVASFKGSTRRVAQRVPHRAVHAAPTAQARASGTSAATSSLSTAT